MQYLIHAVPERLWYVNDYLIPSMKRQDIKENEIEIWLDKEKNGNLNACMKSFLSRTKEGGTWHLQDDVILSLDFAEKTRQYDSGIVCGYCNDGFGHLTSISGETYLKFMWLSFPCIRIPNDIAAECARWFFNDARYRLKYREWVDSRKHDDEFFRDFLEERYPDIKVVNLNPGIIDHIDFLIGGSIINSTREKETRALYFEDDDLVEKLKKDIEAR